MFVIEGKLLKASHRRADVDDVLQSLRLQLLVDVDSAGQPGLARYQGRRPLVGWVWQASLWCASGMDRHWGHRAVPYDEEPLPSRLHDEVDFIESWYKEEFNAACAAVLSKLPLVDRNLLRLLYFDKLSLAQIGRLLKLDKATVCRKLQHIRAAIWEDVAHIMKERTGLKDSDIRNVAAVLQSRLTVSIARLLGT